MLHLLLYTVKQQLIEAAPNWLVYADVFEHPPPRLASRRPIWSDMTSVDTVTQWREDWSSASVDPPHYCYRPYMYYVTARFPSPLSYMVSDEPFLFPCHANLHKWGLTQSPSCDCGQRQTMNHAVDMCPLTKSEGGLNLLHIADDDTVIWLESTVTAALAK